MTPRLKLTTALLALMLAAPVWADEALPLDMGKNLEKSRNDNPHPRSDIMQQKHHYKTMKMKHDAMAKTPAGSMVTSGHPHPAKPAAAKVPAQ